MAVVQQIYPFRLISGWKHRSRSGSYLVGQGCSLLAGGEGFLICDDIVGKYFGLALLKNTFVQANSSEIEGLVLRQVSCGTTSLRVLDSTFEWRAASNTVVESSGPQSYIAELFTKLASEQVIVLTGFQQRYVFKKVVGTSKTTYFVFSLRKNLFNNGTPREPRLYMVEVPSS